ncbi:hypothetical protein INT45_012979 [Circinella minor]|uniref:Nucleolar complex protein 2 n=1 Tax=Circinella minor TaxID=1195481 RepID=A0A8H7RRJ4_9FUNG|nr:hypothetical protein INT45_012979 [Circinella minor]
MAKLKKATVKFQKNKLKNTIERRKKHTKFKQQVNRRKERRSRNQDNGKADSKDENALEATETTGRSIARSDEETDMEFKYKVNNHKVYKKLVRVTLKSAYPIFSEHLFFTKKAKHPAKTKNWRRLEKVVRLFLNNCVRFLRDMDQDDMLQYILTYLEPCSLYFGCFPKTAREYLRVLLDRWSDASLSSESRARCYQSIKQFATAAIDVEKNSYISHCLKGVYLVFAKHATKMTESTLPMIQQMLEEGPDLYTLDQKVSAQHAQVYIHQLTSHLKTAKKQHTAESFKSVYTWQFVSCLDFWANVIANTCNPETGVVSPMLTHLKPLVDLSLQTLRLNPVGQFLPLRVHIIRSLIGIIDGTGYYIPMGPFIFEIFNGDVKSKMEQTDLPAFEWDMYLKTPKEYTSTKIYQDAKYQVFYDSLVDFYACLGLHIAFPELAIPVLSKLKEDHKNLKGTRFSKSLRTLIDKLETHKNYIEQKRAPVEYTSTKLDEVNAFLRNTDFETTPFGNFLVNKAKMNSSVA